MVTGFTIGLIKKRFTEKTRLSGASHAGQQINTAARRAPADFCAGTDHQGS